MGQSWSKMRKYLEQECICESLKGRIQYFLTRYKKSHDQEGRVAIRLDGKEIFKSCFYDWAIKRNQVVKDFVIPDGENVTYNEYWERVHLETRNIGGLDQYSFYNAFYSYQNCSIQESLEHIDPVVRLFAIFDRRVGKRRLVNISPNVFTQPEWLQVFYKIRFEAEAIRFATQNTPNELIQDIEIYSQSLHHDTPH